MVRWGYGTSLIVSLLFLYVGWKTKIVLTRRTTRMGMEVVPIPTCKGPLRVSLRKGSDVWSYLRDYSKTLTTKHRGTTLSVIRTKSTTQKDSDYVHVFDL